MSNLIPGCRAIIVNGMDDNLGKIVTVGNFIGKKDNFEDVDLWEVSRPICLAWWIEGDDEYHYLCSGQTMQRIDEGETSKTNVMDTVEV